MPKIKRRPPCPPWNASRTTHPLNSTPYVRRRSSLSAATLSKSPSPFLLFADNNSKRREKRDHTTWSSNHMKNWRTHYLWRFELLFNVQLDQLSQIPRAERFTIVVLKSRYVVRTGEYVQGWLPRWDLKWRYFEFSWSFSWILKMFYEVFS